MFRSASSCSIFLVIWKESTELHGWLFKSQRLSPSVMKHQNALADGSMVRGEFGILGRTLPAVAIKTDIFWGIKPVLTFRWCFIDVGQQLLTNASLSLLGDHIRLGFLLQAKTPKACCLVCSSWQMNIVWDASIKTPSGCYMSVQQGKPDSLESTSTSKNVRNLTNQQNQQGSV